MSKTRKRYIAKLVGRCVIFLLCFLLCFLRPEIFSVLEGMHFFTRFSPLHLLWLIWVADMLLQIFPIRSKLPLGSHKLFAHRFRPVGEVFSHEGLKNYIATITKAAYRVALLWCALIAFIGVLYYTGIVGRTGLFMITVCFYVCDLICVLIWCPFRLMMKTRCCTTCRIFNWDHLMMFSPLLH